MFNMDIKTTNVVGLIKAGGVNVLLGIATGAGAVLSMGIGMEIYEMIVDPEGHDQKKAARKAYRAEKKAARKAAKLAKKAGNKVNPEKPDETMAEFEVSEEETAE